MKASGYFNRHNTLKYVCQSTYMGPFNTLTGGGGVKGCVKERSQSNVKKRHEGKRWLRNRTNKALRNRYVKLFHSEKDN